MFATLKAAWTRLMAGSASGESDEAMPAVEYQGYRIRPAPYRAEGGHYQTVGVIEKDFPDGTRHHRFVRADTHHSKEDAAAFTISKAKQIIDLQGDKMFV